MSNGALRDARFAWRMLRRSPGFTAVAVATLALGIGANTAVFSVVNQVILQPLRFPDSQRLMAVLSASQEGKTFGSAQGVYLDWHDRATSFETLAGARATTVTWSGVDQAQRLRAVAATVDFFAVIGVRPVLGRLFDKAEEDAVLLDGGFWQRQFGGDPNVLGRTLMLNGKPYTAIGILPAGLRFGYFGARELWLPLAPHREFRAGGDVIAVGRLWTGATRESVQAEMDAIMRQIRSEHRQDSRTYVAVKPLQEWVVGDARQPFLVLLGAVGFVLLICCANIANLLLARSTARQKEMAIRAALGAGPTRLAGQSLVESLLLSLMGGALGAALAVLAVRSAPSIRGFYIPRLEEITVDGRVLIAAAAAALVSSLLFGMAPAWRSGRMDPAAVMQQGGGFGGPSGGRLRNALVVAQLALAFMLLSGAGLMANTLMRLLHIDLGFERDHVVTIGTSLPYPKYDTTRSAEFLRTLVAEVRRMPGVTRASASDYLPLQAVLFPYELRTERGGTARQCEAMARDVDTDYFATIGIPLLAGRDFRKGDDTRMPIPVVINRTVSGLLFGEENPVGREILTNYRERRRLEVIGVAGDSHQLGLTRSPGPQLYLPLVYGSPSFVVARTALNSGGLARAIRAAVRAMDRDVPPPEISTMNDQFSREVAKPRFYLGLLGAFAAMGLVLAAVGIYGVISYSVSRRMREFGIRMALGAERGDLLRLVVRAGSRLTAAGIVLGLAGAAATTRLLSSLLYGVTAGDPVTLGGMVAMLAGVSLGASWLAARKATAADPNVALRCE